MAISTIPSDVLNEHLVPRLTKPTGERVFAFEAHMMVMVNREYRALIQPILRDNLHKLFQGITVTQGLYLCEIQERLVNGMKARNPDFEGPILRDFAFVLVAQIENLFPLFPEVGRFEVVKKARELNRILRENMPPAKKIRR